MEFSKYLRQIRVACGYTQKNVADILGVDRSTYAYYEKGKCEPKIRNLKKLSQLYKISVNDLLNCCMPNPSLQLEACEPISEVSLERFRTLDLAEQKLVMMYRAAADKDGFLDHASSFNNTSGE